MYLRTPLSPQMANLQNENPQITKNWVKKPHFRADTFSEGPRKAENLRICKTY
jgi:hypothetical protein